VGNSKRVIVLALAAALAIPAEGLRQRFYYDLPDGILTVCYGHTGADIDKAKTYSLDECKALLDKDMLYAISTVDSCRPGLPTPVLAAFSDAVYNLGPTIACDTTKSTAARYLAAGDYTAACHQLPRWDKARLAGTLVALPGLTKRRLAERDLCLSYSSPSL
jgi:GH24 family phage-related lysozyme (muramidase)